MNAALKKKQLGQFFTKNADYILQNLDRYIKGKEATDPFAGGSNLMMWARENGVKTVRGFDIDPRYVDNKSIFKNDGLISPKKYKFVLTNPPYLNVNKAKKQIKDKYFKNSVFEDLYQLSIMSIMNSEEGIMIVPLNFLSAENSEKVRNVFFEKFDIIKLNIFTEQVFDDTTYNVISFYYKKKEKNKDEMFFDAHIYPEKSKIKIKLSKIYGWQIGGEFAAKINSVKNTLGIYRLTTDHVKNGSVKIKMAFNNIKDVEDRFVDEQFKEAVKKNILFLRAIDSKNGKKIQLENIRDYKVYGLIGKNSSRNMAHLLFREPLSIGEQEKLIKCFNKELREAREKHLSLFLTNFRDNNRKRISFDFVYKFINYLYQENFNYDKKQSALF